METENIENIGTEAGNIPEQPPLTISRKDVREIIENAFGGEDFLNEELTVEFTGHGTNYNNNVTIYVGDSYIIRIPVIWDRSLYVRGDIPEVTVVTQEWYHGGQCVRESLPVKITED